MIIGSNKSRKEEMEEQLLKFLKYCFMAVMRRLGVEIRAACRHFVCTLRRILRLLLRFFNVFKDDLPQDDTNHKIIELRKLITGNKISESLHVI